MLDASFSTCIDILKITSVCHNAELKYFDLKSENTTEQ